jgi:hypothetical protein
MPTTIEPLGASRRDEVIAFNKRLAEGGQTFAFPEVQEGLISPDSPECTVRQTAYVLSDGTAVRGGYILKSERFRAAGRDIEVGNFQLPLSEGTVDRRYGIVGVQLVKDVLGRQTRLYCLGMGSLERPLPMLLDRLGWTVEPVPFRFRIVRANGFLGNIVYLRQRPRVRLVLDLARWTGIGSIAVQLKSMLTGLRSPAIPAGVQVREVPDFGVEVDPLFEACAAEYGLLSDRRAATLRQKLPANDPRLLRLLLFRDQRLIGWVVVSRSQLRDHKQFGNMRLGAIVDGLGSEQAIPWLVRAAVDRLQRENVDLIVTNQTNQRWLEALDRHGFLAGPSNFILARSPPLVADTPASGMHFTRCDGDGPINL